MVVGGGDAPGKEGEGAYLGRKTYCRIGYCAHGEWSGLVV